MSRTPLIATYRLQLTDDFDFAAATAVLPYLRDLGISHVYLSPLTEARPGSTHGYDVVDHNQVRQSLGGAAGLKTLLDACSAADLQAVIDIVPNHAGLGPQNQAWQDVLAHGPHSPHAPTFDIEWRPAKPELHGRLLLPFLGKNYGHALEAGELVPVFEGGRLALAYFDHRFAMQPASYADALDLCLRHAELSATDRERVQSWQKTWRSWEPGDRPTCTGWQKDWGEALQPIAAALDAGWRRSAERPEEQPALHALLQQQAWRLANWRTASHEINYRRFFEINDLIGLRMEDPAVFASTHRWVAELVQHPAVAGLRIDHVDGLYDPPGYLAQLRQLGAPAVWVEKILAPDEDLSADWHCDGTTGYEFGAAVLALFTPPQAVAQLTQLYRELMDGPLPYAEVVYQSKRLTMTTKLAGELQRLALQLDRLSEADICTRDFTFLALREGLIEVTAALGRYRTYLPQQPDDAAAVVAAAVAEAQGRNLALDKSVFAFVGEMLCRPSPEANRRSFIGRWQQFSAPVMAKSVEDTAFYRHPCLLAHNEVGASPSVPWLTDEAFVEQATWRAQHYPNNLLGTSTHDSKRGEDTRLRIAMLAERPQAWRALVLELMELGEAHRTTHEGRRFPAADDLYLFLQTLVAVWEPGPKPAQPAADSLQKRLAAMWLKSAREAKRWTSWTNPHAVYETSLERYVDRLCADPAVQKRLGEFTKTLHQEALVASLSQLVLKCTTPGVPDFYQGTEYLDLSLVDPDNRRPVDYTARRNSLAQAKTLSTWQATDPNALKQRLTARLLQLRRQGTDLQVGKLILLRAAGDQAESAFCFLRGAYLVVVPKRFATASTADEPFWHATHIALPDAWKNKRLVDQLSMQTLQGTDQLDLGQLPLPWAVLTIH
jgi:(1->4)-alpha-D-glucan 1-alpha-D-glucosylmutase